MPNVTDAALSPTHIALTCLGTFTVAVNGSPVTHFPTDKVRALLAYLALQPGPHRRETLAGLLWPNIGQDYALKNLRNTLHRLRQTLQQAEHGVGDDLDGVFPITRQTIELNRAALDVDAVKFEALVIECEQHQHAGTLTCAECLTRLAQAADLYRGELLAGFGLADAPAFEEWVLVRRESIHHHMLLALGALTEGMEQQGDYQRALAYANRQIALDPYREGAHRQVMRLLAQLDQPHHAMAHYDAVRRMLHEELGAAPAAETAALYEDIRSGHFRLMRSHDAIENRSTEIAYWSGVPDPGALFGREAELAEVMTWLTQDHTRIVTVLGLGGVGKTTLAASVARSVAGQFDRVFWQSLLNAPPLSEVLQAWLQALSGQSLTTLPTGLDAQLSLLLDGLRRQRCLLVLDNFESILQPDQPGRVLPGYEGYDQLIQRVADFEHQSCLIVTSRERPHALMRREGDAHRVRTLSLDGLDAMAGRAMLAARGLSGADADVSALVRRYSGNPLALKLVAQTIRELFAGDVATFLVIEAPIFDDIRAVLDQQFARLLPLEREIMTWLAIERESVPVQALRDDLVHPPPMSVLLDALRALQRRSLVGQGERGVHLQNVVTEYVTDVLVGQISHEVLNSPTNNPKSKIEHPKLNAFALLKATAKEYARASQMRLIVQPIATQVSAQLGKAGLVERLNAFLAELRAQPAPMSGYAAGNILNLLLHLSVDVQGYDFSQLNVWQAYLRGKGLPGVNFAQADLTNSVFTDTFRTVDCVAFGPHAMGAGQLLAAGSGDGTIRLWRVADWKPCGVCAGHTSFVWSVAFSPDGQWLASAGEDGTVCVWDVHDASISVAERGQLRYRLRGHSRWLKCVAFSPDGALLASSGGDGTVRLWNTRTWETVNVLHGHSGGIWSVAFSPDGRTLASGSEDSTVRVWDVSTGTHLHTLHGHDGRVTQVAWSPDGALLASGAHDGTIRIWDACAAMSATRNEPIEPVHIYRITAGWVDAFAFSPDGTLIVAGCGDCTVRIWEVGNLAEAGRLVHSLYMHTDPITAVAFGQDGAFLVTAGGDNILRLWDARRNWEPIDSLHGYRRAAQSAVFCLSGTAVGSGGLDGVVRVWHAQTGRLLHAMSGHTHMVRSVAADRDGARLASGSNDHTVRVWDLQSGGRTIHELRGHTGNVIIVCFSPNGELLASGSDDGTVRVWDLRRGEAIHTLPMQRGTVMAVAFSPDGAWLASAGRDRVISISDMRTGQTRARLHGHTKWIKSLHYSPDGVLLASGSDEDVVRLWNAHTGEIIKTLHGHTNVIEMVAFSPRPIDSRLLLASASYDGTVRVWDANTGDTVHCLQGHTNWVRSVAFSPDGEMLVSSSDDETIKLWDIRTGECLRTLRVEGPYAGMNITGVTGISPAQKAVLKALGAVDWSSTAP